MPRFALALLLVPACFFDADLSHAHLRCSDGVCPSDLACVNQTCTPRDAAPRSDASGTSDAPEPHDAHTPALTCADPGSAMATQNGSTMGRSNELSTTCGGIVYNGPDAVYRIDGPRQVTIGISGSYAVAAYVIDSCTASTCQDNMSAQPAAPLTLSLTSGEHLIVVDGVNAALSGTYTLTVQ
jgi:hypothetical protein